MLIAFLMMTGAGLLMLAASLSPIQQIVGMVRKESVKKGWTYLYALVTFMCLSYGAYAILGIKNELAAADLIAAAILFASGGFVFTVTNLARITGHDILRIVELEKEAKFDPLTGILNRRYLDDGFESEFNRSRYSDIPLSALMIDIDHFKDINDTYGHKVGDQALKHVSSILKEHCRASDSVVRYGGEEFLIVASGADMSAATILASRLLAGMANTPLTVDDNTRLAISFSIGIASVKPSDTVQTFLQRADEALYTAKRAGRNRYCTSAATDTDNVSEIPAHDTTEPKRAVS